MSATKVRQGWDWRQASGGWIVTEKETFHAYDSENHAACNPIFSLNESVADPTEGSMFCNTCMDTVRSNPFPS